MIFYETLILARPEITEDELNQLERYFYQHLSGNNGDIVAFDKWGKLRLAYSVNKNDYGFYLLVRYHLAKNFNAEFMQALATFFKVKCHDFVMRFVTIKLNKNTPKDYAKPEANDGQRSGAGIDAFFKDNKMGGVLPDITLHKDDGIEDGIQNEEKDFIQG